MQQLNLWSAEDEQAMIPAGYRVVPDIGQTMEVKEFWADGDTRPESLARLAEVLLGHLEFLKATNDLTHWFTCWFRIVGTRVEGDHVVATLLRIEPLRKSYADYHPEDDSDVD